MSPDARRHRGAHPEDAGLFAPDRLPALRAATRELSWLLSHGYPPTASLKLVGDHRRLNDRQRVAVSRAACADESRERRSRTCISPDEVTGRELVVDGFNLIITLEAALGHGVLLVCRDGCVRDISSVHGSYRSVEETERAVTLLGEALEARAPASVEWLLDAPISNSGRLAQLLREMAERRGWPWEVELVFNPDSVIRASEKVAVTSDSGILEGVARWTNLTPHLLQAQVPDAWLVDLRE